MRPCVSVTFSWGGGVRGVKGGRADREPSLVFLFCPARVHRGWTRWAKEAAKAGYTSVLVEVDPENKSTKEGSSALLSELSAGPLPPSPME